MNFARKLLIPLPLLMLFVPLSVSAENSASSVSATVETGGAGIAVSDDIKRVNEYSVIRTKPGVNPYGKVDLRVREQGIVFDGTSRFMDSRDQTHEGTLDIKRVVRTSFSYDAFQHWLDHDQLNYLDAAIPPASSYTGNAANPLPLTPNTVPGYWYTPLPGTTTPAYGGSSATPPAGYQAQQIGRATLYGEDLTPNSDFSIVRREWKSDTDLTIPQLPNLTFHFNYRNEQREGVEQSIGMSKCTSCHITGGGKNIDENTRDISAGVTGRFGLLTLTYTFLNRQFRENAAAPTRLYDPALSPGQAYAVNGPFDNRLLYDYENGPLRYDATPDSNKNSHVVKAKVDLPGEASVFASYVNTKVDSSKSDEPGIFTLDRQKLESTYDSFGGRVTTKVGKRLTFTLRGKTEKIRNDDVGIAFTTLSGTGTAPNQFVPDPTSLQATRYSALSRDSYTIGLDAVYRLARRTTLRLGYDFNEVNRHEQEFGDSKIHTVKASINTRPSTTLSARASYTFKKIDDPFVTPAAALVPMTDVSGNITVGNGPTYGIDFYNRRTADLSNQPDTVHEGNVSATWSPGPRFSTTAYYRIKAERNDLNKGAWKQTSHGPGLTVWYAPTDKVSMTLAYNYQKQKTENMMCQGLYDG